ncbi:hypothetical protein [Clostridium sp.]|uniref:hypothetical protein n=1 Tax=Clostridium sp. TaxID=1506 RepID=UPI001A424EEA|nr:hypothetical protein [Clostridium sp.]MBK5234070.1 hypothetical protein [Clostridium sp.]
MNKLQQQFLEDYGNKAVKKNQELFTVLGTIENEFTVTFRNGTKHAFTIDNSMDMEKGLIDYKHLVPNLKLWLSRDLEIEVK